MLLVMIICVQIAFLSPNNFVSSVRLKLWGLSEFGLCGDPLKTVYKILYKIFEWSPPPPLLLFCLWSSWPPLGTVLYVVLI